MYQVLSDFPVSAPSLSLLPAGCEVCIAVLSRLRILGSQKQTVHHRSGNRLLISWLYSVSVLLPILYPVYFSFLKTVQSHHIRPFLPVLLRRHSLLLPVYTLHKVSPVVPVIPSLHFEDGYSLYFFLQCINIHLYHNIPSLQF